jgi:hypothetical protein
MPFDIERIRNEVLSSPLLSPYPPELAVAVVNDCFRSAGCAPIADDRWARWLARERSLAPEQISMLGYLLSVTSMRDETVPLLPRAKAPTKAMEGFLNNISPLTAEMIRANRFRQEEFVRRWAEAWGGTILGETPEVSRQRADQLDYRRTMKEFAAAEAARKAEAERRAALLREAAEREAAARGWRE